LVGPWEMIAVWGKIADGPSQCLMIAENERLVSCYGGMIITPHATFDNCPKLDYLLVPGGMGTRTEVNNKRTAGFISDKARGCKAVLSVCTGSFLLHAAGLLKGKKATTHHLSKDRLRELGDVDVVDKRVVRDGNIWTSAGVSAGIDLALEFIEEVSGKDISKKVRDFVEY